MTAENRRRNIAIELACGTDALRAAELLLSAGMHRDAVSRAYYAAFHHARALLLTMGTETATHRGLVQVLHRDFVRAGKLDADVALTFSQMQRFRQDADYSAEVVFTALGAAREVESARRFVEAVTAVLTADGWTAKPIEHD